MFRKRVCSECEWEAAGLLFHLSVLFGKRETMEIALFAH
jgi:hypothetical protein